MIESKLNKRIIKTIFGQKESDIEAMIREHKKDTKNKSDQDESSDVKKSSVSGFFKSGIQKLKKEMG